jgi:hypothetical protein
MRVDQRPVECPRVFGVVTAGRDVVGERSGIEDLDRDRPDPDVDAESGKERANLSMEIRHRHRPQRNRACGPVAQPHDQDVIDQVELEFEEAGSVRDR